MRAHEFLNEAFKHGKVDRHHVPSSIGHLFVDVGGYDRNHRHESNHDGNVSCRGKIDDSVEMDSSKFAEKYNT